MTTVFLGDARNLSQYVAPESVALVVTSPPYWCIKDYGIEGQIGHGQTYDDYLNALEDVWSQCYYALRPGCRMCVVIGDQFLRAAEHGRYHVAPLRADTTVAVTGRGFDYMGSITWQKTTTCNPSGGARIMGSYPYPRNGIVKIDNESILIFKKPGRTPPPADPDTKERSVITLEEWNVFFAGTWKIPGERMADHPAAFPVKIPRRLVRMFSFAGETVLDPFIGSGATAIACRETGRSCIGVELNPEYVDIARNRVPGLQVVDTSGETA